MLLLINFNFASQPISPETQTSNVVLNPAFIEDLGTQSRNAKINTLPSVKESIDTLNLPKAKFDSWHGFKAINVPESLAFYQLKEDYSLPEIKTLAQKLSAFDTVKEYEKHVLSYTIGQKGQVASLLLFKKNSGEFSYSATNGLPLSSTLHTMNDKIYDFLKTIKWYDPTLKIIANYKLRNNPDVTYFEVKRDWESTGLPILNPIGLLNLDDNDSVQSLEQNDPATSVRTNPDIYNTSDKKDGLERNTDFNTMTIGISNLTNSVVVINSNIRKLATTEVVKTKIISYEEAVARLKNNEESFILTTPTNVTDIVEWQKIYPKQLAQAKQATITESSLAYLEQSPSSQQKTLEAHYIFRGKARLASNFEVNFIAAVSALHKTQASKANPFAFIPQVYAGTGDVNNPIGQLGSQKQGAFELDITPPEPTPTIPPFASCVPGVDDLNPLNPSLGNSRARYGWSPIAIIDGEVRISKKGWWYYVPDSSTTDATLKNDVFQILAQIQTIIGQRNFRNFNTGLPPNILSDYQATGNTCPIRVTGDSPTIFIYAPENSYLSIKPASAISYAEPILTSNSWNIQSNEGGSLVVNNRHHKYLYYEYSGVIFSRPEKGWVVKKNETSSFAKNTLSPALQLNTQEQERLLYELEHATKKLANNTVYIGMIDRNELDKKLPLTVSAKTEIYRYFFYVGEVTGETEAPLISPVQRSHSMIVELGSYAEK